jgi:hypothetical protein
VPVEELDVSVEVLVEVPPGHQRPADRPHGVHAQREHKEDDGAEPTARELLQPRKRASRGMS